MYSKTLDLFLEYDENNMDYLRFYRKQVGINVDYLADMSEAMRKNLNRLYADYTSQIFIYGELEAIINAKNTYDRLRLCNSERLTTQ